MVFLVFAKLCEMHQFLIALKAGYHMTYFDRLNFLTYVHPSTRKLSYSYLVRFGTKVSPQQSTQLPGVKVDKDKKETVDVVKDQYFAIFICLDTNSEDFPYELMNRVKQIKQHDPTPALILIGTAGGSKIATVGRISNAIKAIKLDKKVIEMGWNQRPTVDKEKIQSNEKLPWPFAVPKDDETSLEEKKYITYHLEAALADFVVLSDQEFTDAESFAFCKACRHMDITDYACVRICSWVPGNVIDIKDKPLGEFNFEFSYAQDHDQKNAQAEKLKEIFEKFIDFTNVVKTVLEILGEYSLKRVKRIPKNHYENGKSHQPQDYLVRRRINEKLTNIYTFPLQDEYYHTSSTNKEDHPGLKEHKEVWAKLVEELIKG